MPDLPSFLRSSTYPPGEGIIWAERALAWLNEFAWDPSHGGYWGSFRRNNERYSAGVRLSDSRWKRHYGTSIRF